MIICERVQLADCSRTVPLGRVHDKSLGFIEWKSKLTLNMYEWAVMGYSRWQKTPIHWLIFPKHTFCQILSEVTNWTKFNFTLLFLCFVHTPERGKWINQRAGGRGGERLQFSVATGLGAAWASAVGYWALWFPCGNFHPHRDCRLQSSSALFLCVHQSKAPADAFCKGPVSILGH